MMFREYYDGDQKVSIYLSTQILRLHIPEEMDFGTVDQAGESELFPSVSSVDGMEEFLSASVAVSKAKQFDDGLFAAVEGLCYQGTEKIAGKTEILEHVGAALKN